jgi:putative ABC transport system permease protein
MFQSLWQDTRYALRGLRRNPAFSITAILAAAVGIGATSAVFSAVDRILFRALPYENEDRIVSVGMMAPLDTTEFFLPEQYFDLRRNPGPLEEVAAFQAGEIATDLTEGDPVRLAALRLEANFLDVFGIRPAAGRMFTREEDRPGGPRVALISYALWRTRFAADPRAIGRNLLLDGEPVEIVGVLPRGFEMPTLAHADVVLPLALDESRERSGRALRAFARLKSGVRQAIEMLQPQFRRALDTVPPQFRKEISFRVRPVRERQVGDARMASLALFGSVIAVLLIACANIASLLLARAVARERELAIRAALGASRWRLIRQALTESLILSAAGGAAGCAFARGLLRVFVAIAPAGLPRLNEAAIDSRVLLFTVGAALASGLLFGLAPALRKANSESRHATARSRGGLRSVLVTAEIAFSMTLLTGGGLLLHSLWKLESVPLGMERSHVVTARFVLGRQRYSRTDQQLAFFNELEQRLQSAAGVETAAITDSLPPLGGMRGRLYSSIAVDGRLQPPQGTGGMVSWRYVTRGYFSVLGIPIVRGRAFIEQDRDPAAFAVILSETLARRMFPHEDPLGKRILKSPYGEWTTVVGVARDVTNLGATRESWPEYYILRKPVADFNFENQEPGSAGWRAASIVARTGVDPRLAESSIRGILKSLDATLPVEMQTMEQRLQDIDQKPRFYAILLAAFAAMGALIAAVGLFGVLSFLVARRTREIGVRVALGAMPRQIVGMTIWLAGQWTFAGIALGLMGSLAVARLLRSMLFQIQPVDPASVGAAIAVVCAIALLAAAAPARRAARIDPVQALRQD